MLNCVMKYVQNPVSLYYAPLQLKYMPDEPPKYGGANSVLGYLTAFL
jgi:hypothetical protein